MCLYLIHSRAFAPAMGDEKRLVRVAAGRQAAVYRVGDNHLLKVPWVAMTCMQEHAVLKLIGILPGVHPNVAPMLCMATVGEKTGVLMQHIRGPTLAMLAHTTTRRAEMSGRVFWDVMHGLEYLHKHGVLHLDVAPSNVMYCVETSRFVLIDVALHRKECTPCCMAPDREYCEQSDTWSLGCTLLYVLTGNMPWTSSQDRIHIFAQLYAKRTPPEAATVPASWHACTDIMLCTSTALRPTPTDILSGNSVLDTTFIPGVLPDLAYAFDTCESWSTSGFDVDTCV